MKIYIAADHRGFNMKNEIVAWLKSEGYEVTDLGPNEHEPTDDYPDYGIKVARAVGENSQENLGILICGSGIGMSVTANKVNNVRSAPVYEPELARSAKNDDNINVLALGSSFVNLETAKQIISTWLNTPFAEEERYQRRIDKIKRYENNK